MMITNIRVRIVGSGSVKAPMEAGRRRENTWNKSDGTLHQRLSQLRQNSSTTTSLNLQQVVTILNRRQPALPFNLLYRTLQQVLTTLQDGLNTIENIEEPREKEFR